MTDDGPSFDVIGDVHGDIGAWRRLLEPLGYVKERGRFSHPEGRQVVCVGDLVDQGPDPLACLELMRELVDDGVGHWVLGNHELNFLHLEAGLRQRSPRNEGQAKTTLRQTEAQPGRWEPLRSFLLDTPLKLELDSGRLRVIHACWNSDLVATLPTTLREPDALRRTAAGGDLLDAVEACLKGPEVEVPEFEDSFGHPRTRRRHPWWTDYPADAPTVVFGHYRFPGDDYPKEPQTLGPGANAICVDFNAAGGGRLVAFRFPENEFLSVAGTAGGD